MWHQLWIPVLIPTLIIKSNCDVNKTDPDVFVRYAGHAEAEYVEPTTTTKEAETTTTVLTTTRTTTKATTTMKYNEDSTDSVMFIPNKKSEIRRDEDEFDKSLKIKDIMNMKTVNDAMNKNFHVEKDIDTPNEDIVFISGKNHDAIVKTKEEENARRSDTVINQDEEANEDEYVPKQICADLDCSNTLQSVCGAKFLNNKWSYRLFLNDCFFRKVNCGFKYEINRYKLVPVENCKTVGAHYTERPFSFKPKLPISQRADKFDLTSGKSHSSRRSMTKNINGQFCSHPCPISCPDDYDPQCAISGTGIRRVFINHCKLDLNSCFYGVVWHKRHLSECVGNKKADLRHNRGFIGWMQRVGIVDNKGRLVLE